MAETSTKPYMIRALYEWCCDNGYTPYLAVAVDEHTIVPRQHVKGGEIVLNVSPMATSRLSLGNELVEFQARFSGVAQQISIPVGNISAIYARETGHGMAFDVSKAPAVGDEGSGREAIDDAHDRAPDHTQGVQDTDDDTAHHSPGSSVQSLRGGSRRRGPRGVAREDAPQGAPASGGRRADGKDEGEVEGEGDDGGHRRAAGEAGPGEPAANSRKRSAKGQASADVIAFAPSGGAGKKRSSSAPSQVNPDDSADEPLPAAPKPGDDDEDPPPADGGGKGGKARLTRVK